MTDKEQRIIKETDKLYQSYGIKSITMDDVAKNLGISKKTLYQYVNDKVELVSKVLSLHSLRFESKLHKITARELNPVDELIELSNLVHKMIVRFNHSMDFDLNKYYTETYGSFKSHRRKLLKDTILINLVRGIEKGYYRKEINPDIISILQMVRIENLFESGLLDLDEVGKNEFFAEALAFYIYGITNEKGRKYFKKKTDQ